MRERIRAIQWGVGTLGKNTARMITTKQSVALVGAIVRPGAAGAAGRDVGELIGLNKKIGVIASDDANRVLETPADVVLLTTAGPIDDYVDCICRCLAAGKNVITSVGFFYPWYNYPHIAAKIDRLAKDNGVSFLGSGLYPGFYAYFHPILTGGTARVDAVIGEYWDDLTGYDTLLMMRDQMRIGVDPAQFDTPAGRPDWLAQLYVDVVHYTADVLGWELTEVKTRWDTYTTDKVLKTAAMEVLPGTVYAYKITTEGLKGDKVVLGANYGVVVCPDQVENPPATGERFSITVDGLPPLQMEIKCNLVHWGSLFVAAPIVNAIPLVVKARPGLISLNDIPPVIAIQ